MKKLDIARALKDNDYFNSLSDEDKALVLAVSPVGIADVKDEDLLVVSGGLAAAASGSGSGSGSGGDAAFTCDCQCNCSCDCGSAT